MSATEGGGGATGAVGARLPLELLESAVNRLLALDPEFLEELGRADPMTVGVRVEGLGLSLTVTAGGQGVALAEGVSEQPPPDVVLSAPPLALLRMLRGGDADESFPDDLRIVGDVAVAQRLRAAMARLDIDWEEQLAALVGDVAAHQLALGVRGMRAWGERAARHLSVAAAEYLSEESELLASGGAAEAFANEVEDLRDDVERLEARVNRLASRGGGGR